MNKTYVFGAEDCDSHFRFDIRVTGVESYESARDSAVDLAKGTVSEIGLEDEFVDVYLKTIEVEA